MFKRWQSLFNKTLAVLCFILAITKTTWAACPAFLGSLPVSHELMDAMNAARGNFRIRALHKIMEDGTPRVIILAGEKSEIKTQETATLGSNLIDQVEFRGLDTSEIQKQSVLNAVLNPTLYAVNLASQKLLNLEDSSIQDAVDDLTLDLLKDKLAREIAAKIEQSTGQDVITITPEIEAMLKGMLASTHIAIGDLKSDGTELLPLVREYLTLRGSPLEAPDRVYARHIDILKDHRPNVWERLEQARIPIAFTVLAANLALKYWIGHHTAQMLTWTAITSGLLNGHNVYNLAQSGAQRYFENTREFKVFFPLYGQLVKNQNATRYRNIQKGFVENPNYDHMLVLLNASHVNGLADMFLADGYDYIPEFAPKNWHQLHK